MEMYSRINFKGYYLLVYIASIVLTSVQSCDENQLQSMCLKTLGQALSFPDNKVEPLHLLALTGPWNDDAHKQACDVLSTVDFGYIQTCVSDIGCANTDALSSGEIIKDEMATMTWKVILELIEGICKEGCEDLRSINAEMITCVGHIRNVTQGDCGTIENMFQCYMDAIGSCKALVSYLEYTIVSLGYMKIFEDCPDINFSWNEGTSLEEVKNDSSTESSFEIMEYENTTCGGEPNLSSCCSHAVPSCFSQIYQIFTLSNDTSITEVLGKLINVMSYDEEQDVFCSASEIINYNTIFNCIKKSGCTDTPISSGEYFSWAILAELFRNTCSPDCSDIGNKTLNVGQCTVETGGQGEQGFCSVMEWVFQCSRNVIGDCFALSKLVEHAWTINNMMESVNETCPGIDLSLYGENNSHDVTTESTFDIMEYENTTCGGEPNPISCCSHAVPSCFAQIYQIFTLSNDTIITEVFGKLINVMSYDEEQDVFCSASEIVDYSTIFKCIKKSGCTDTPISSGEYFSWAILAELFRNTCLPDCSDIGNKTLNVGRCTVEMSGHSEQGFCSVMEWVFQCSRNVVGDCFALSKLVEHAWTINNMLESVNETCPGIDLSLYGENNSHDVTTESTFEIMEYENTTCGGEPNPSNCCSHAVPICFSQMYQIFTLSNDTSIMAVLGKLINVMSYDEEQDVFCSASEIIDYNTIFNCIKKSGCTDTPISSGEYFSWAILAELFRNTCSPDCSDMGNKTLNVGRCTVETSGQGEQGFCSVMERVFQCSRNVIGDCFALSKIGEHAWTINNMLESVNETCPGIDLSLYEESDSENVTTVNTICSNEALSNCLSDMESKLGLAESQFSGMQLYSILIPDNAVLQQDTCGRLEDVDFVSLKSCIIASGCSNSSILPPELDGRPDVPKVTWFSGIGLVESLCGSRCTNYFEKTQTGDECAKWFAHGNQDICSQVQRIYRCYRNATGKCQVAITFAEAFLNSKELVTEAKEVCQSDIFNLSVSDSENSTCNTKSKKELIEKSVIKSLSNACDETTVATCYDELAQKLGTTSDAIMLYVKLLPTTNEDQKETCSSVKNFQSFDKIKSCVQTKGCSDTAMVSSGVGIITWFTYADYIQSMCKPGCDDVEAMTTNSERCSTMFTGGSDIQTTCRDLGSMMQCYRDIIGKCDLLVAITESVLESTGVIDQLKPICTDVDFSFSSEEDSSEEDSSEELSEESNSVESVEKPAECDKNTIFICFQPLGNQSTVSDIMSTMFSPAPAKDEATVNKEQRQLCSVVANTDVTSIKKCITDKGCADTNLLPPGSQMDVTWINVVDMMVGICETGCENIGTKTKQVQECSKRVEGGQTDDHCEPAKKLFQCFRNNIGHCDILVKLVSDQVSSITDMLKEICKDVNFDLHATSNTRNIYMSMSQIHKRMNLVDVATRFNIFKATRQLHDLTVRKRAQQLKNINVIKAIAALKLPSHR